MKKAFFILFVILLNVSMMAQQKIQLRSADRAECLKSDMTSLKASFSFSTLEAQDYESQRGVFSWLSMPNTVIGGNEGDPQIPVVNELIAVPFGANPRIEITGYSTTDYRLDDLGIHTLVPRQPSLRKDQQPDDVPFIINEAAYRSTRGFRSEPQAVVNVVGTMRGVRLGKMTIEPVSYDPVNNTLRVFNDIEVTVHFDGADAVATEKMLVDTYSPYFNVVYKQLFNERTLRDAYSQHPDLYTTPVKMLVVTTSTYVNSTVFQNWLTWKKQKGIDVDVQTVASGATASTIKNLIYSRYNANHPTFLVIVGDETVVTYYQLWNYGSSYGNAATDLEYASVDGDVYHDMFISRMSVSSTTELGYLVNKTLTYEKYTMSDPSYLSNVLLIAGADGTWAPKVGRPTINYAANYYFNTAHGFNNVYKYVTDTYTGCYNYLSSGVGFANYTAHGDIQKWHSPEFTNSNVNSLTNNDKYFWAMGNCCLTSNFKNASNDLTCFGEAMIRAANKGAFGYIGSVPESYWYEDYYFGVGATTTFNQTPTQAQTTTGVYDAMFDDSGFNTLNAVPFIGNVAVTYAHAGNYQYSVSDEYYWRAYQCFGDGSVMPYHTQPSANNVSHANTIGVGVATFTVNAVAGSYVSITKNNEILGVAEVPASGTVNVPITGLNSAGEVMIVVTRQQRQPYITTIQAVSLDGPYITVDGYTPNMALVGENTDLSITFKNVGSAATSGNTTVTLTSTNSNVTILSDPKTFSTLGVNATTTVNGFRFRLNSGVTLGVNVTLHYTAVNGSNTWEGDITITPNQIFMVTVAANNADYGTVSGGGQYNYGASCTVTATPADGYMFTNWTENGSVVSTDAEYTFNVASDMNLVANFAEGVMIGSGTETNDFLPSYSYYKHALSEQIYTPAELGSAGLITSIAFYNGGAEKTRTYDFYLKATTKNTFTGTTDWIAVSAGDKVFSGSVTMIADDWTTITFSTPFVYDGTSNVVLVADDNTGSYTYSPHMSCRVFTATNQALYYYDDNNNFNPLSPPTSSGSSNNVLSSKNQLIVTKLAIPTEPVNITVSANPARAASVSGGGEYPFGETCTVTATPNEGYTFMGWTENGGLVSSELSYSFSAIADRSLVANFIQTIEIGEGTTTHNYLPSYNYYNYTLSQQIYTAAEIGTEGTITSIAFYNEGAEKTRTYDLYLKTTNKSSFSSKTDWITVSASDKVFSGSVTMVVNNWTFITLDTPFEYDGISNLVLVADDNTGEYTSSPHMACSVFNTTTNQAIYAYNDNTNFNPLSPPTSSSNYNDVLRVKNHILLGMVMEDPQVEQVVALGEGWNWWSPYIEMNGIDGLTMLEEGLGDNGLRIQSKSDGSVDWLEYNGTGYWYGSLNALANEQMYMIRASADCNAVMVGAQALTEDHPVAIIEGWNWIGFPSGQTVSVETALSSFAPETEDVIKGRNGSSTYISSGSYNQWYGTLSALEPGQGYMYKSNSSTPKTLTFQSGRDGDNIEATTHEGTVFTPNRNWFADNMLVTAVIDLGGQELRSEKYEVAAFVDGECRGSVKLMYVEPLDRYVAFLLVSGEAGEKLSFVLTDGNSIDNSVDNIKYVVDGIEGSPTEPVVLHFNPLSASEDCVRVYPNPSKDVFNIEGEGIQKVEVVNAFGQVVYIREAEGDAIRIDLGNCASGVYMLRVVSEKGITTQQILKTR